MNRSLQRLEQQMDEMELRIPFWASKDQKVSKVPVGWHVAHSLKVIDSALKGLERSEPAHYRKTFSLKKELCFLQGEFQGEKPELQKSPVQMKMSRSQS